jgi:hypothetical protein
VGIVIKSGDLSLFFAGDHMLSQDWFLRDLNRRRYAHSVHFHSRREAITTSKRIATFIEQTPTILVPIHDPTGSDRIAARGPIAKV